MIHSTFPLLFIELISNIFAFSNYILIYLSKLTAPAAAAPVVQIAAPALSQKILFVVSAQLTNSKLTKGIRALVYHNGAKNSAMYHVDKSQSIFYDGDNLAVKLLFENQSGCSTFLDNLHEDLANFRFATNLKFSKSFEKVIVTETPEYMMKLDYDPNDSSSAEHSYAATVLTHVSEFAGTTTEGALLMIENPNNEEFFRLRPYRCHLKSRSGFPEESNNPNNTLIMSWSQHQRFDGLNTVGVHLIPQIAISFVRRSNTIVDVNGFLREEVTIAIESPDPMVLTTVQSRMKPGSAYDAVNKRITSYVYVENAEEFQRCLMHKYKETRILWETMTPGAEVTADEAAELRRSARLKNQPM